MKLLLTLGMGGLLAAVGIACIGGTGGETVLIHGHAEGQVYEVTVPADQVEALLQEEGDFHCENGVCHIE